MNTESAPDTKLLRLVWSFGGTTGPLGGIFNTLQKEVWNPHIREEGTCKWSLAWEDVFSIFAEEFSKEELQP